MTKEEELYNTIGEQISGALQSQMFGKPCFKINGKAFICFFKNAMVFKLKLNSEPHKAALYLTGTQLFDPSGKKRPMKEWVQIPFNLSERWKEFAICAKNYVIQS